MHGLMLAWHEYGDFVVTEADGTGTDKRMGGAPATPEGVRPQYTKEPIRKRGYHRALRRGEGWALMRKCMNDMLRRLSMDLFKPNPFLDKHWHDSSKFIGISYGLKNDKADAQQAIKSED